jgi:hypothetical protein
MCMLLHISVLRSDGIMANHRVIEIGFIELDRICLLIHLRPEEQVGSGNGRHCHRSKSPAAK